jgi:hypothetical protein
MQRRRVTEIAQLVDLRVRGWSKRLEQLLAGCGGRVRPEPPPRAV